MECKKSISKPKNLEKSVHAMTTEKEKKKKRNISDKRRNISDKKISFLANESLSFILWLLFYKQN